MAMTMAAARLKGSGARGEDLCYGHVVLLCGQLGVHCACLAHACVSWMSQAIVRAGTCSMNCPKNSFIVQVSFC